VAACDALLFTPQGAFFYPRILPKTRFFQGRCLLPDRSFFLVLLSTTVDWTTGQTRILSRVLQVPVANGNVFCAFIRSSPTVFSEYVQSFDGDHVWTHYDGY
jgi:hypothetical protein